MTEIYQRTWCVHNSRDYNHVFVIQIVHYNFTERTVVVSSCFHSKQNSIYRNGLGQFRQMVC